MIMEIKYENAKFFFLFSFGRKFVRVKIDLRFFHINMFKAQIKYARTMNKS